MINRKIFFARVRAEIFHGSLDQRQVDGLNTILNHAEDERTNLEYLAYMLATTFHETAEDMQPIDERGGVSYFTRLYDIKGQNPKLAKRLGNVFPGDGAKYHGRGYVQLTGRDNYDRASRKLGVDFVQHPEWVKKPRHAVAIMFMGMTEGWFTGKDVHSYMDGIDGTDAEDRKQFKLSRYIINGKDRRDDIADYAIKFEHALRAAYDGADAIVKPADYTAPDMDVKKTYTWVDLLVKFVAQILKGLRK